MEAFDPRRRLTTRRLLLRPLAEGDADDLVAGVAGDPELLRWMPWAAGYDRARAVEWCASAHRDPAHARHFAVVPHGDGHVRGAVGLVRASWEYGTVEVGYWLAARARGNGYAAEATVAVAAHAFERGMFRVELLAATGNIASQRVAVRAGFTREGVLRQARPVPGGRADMVVFGLLRGEQAEPGG